MKTITLLTDFGEYDEYVGVMKGVIIGICPNIHIIDISHHISPQNIREAAFMIQAAYSYFPKGTIHVVVVDPGVGGTRSIIALKQQEYFFIAPNNGVLSFIIDQNKIQSIVAVNNPLYYSKIISDTFHGRDIFAPVAAHLAKGLDISCLGNPFDINDFVRLDFKTPIFYNNVIEGDIIWVDRFGNLVTNIKKVMIPNSDRYVKIVIKLDGVTNDIVIDGIVRSYCSVEQGTFLAIWGSRGFLEISINKGNAKNYLDNHVRNYDFVKIIILYNNE